MPTKALQFSIIIFILILVGLVRYAIMWSNEQSVHHTQQSVSTERTVAMNQQEPLSKGVQVTESFQLPVSGSSPTESVKHTIDLQDIKRGCFLQDCIPSIEEPVFKPASELVDVLDPDSLGIVLWEADRFYAFPMLETHELVNETLPDGSAVLISYCPLCGTGIVFNRELNGVVVEFGVSGMLWQSNLLMYNRADSVQDRNLWSQVLGKAVVGDRAGEDLEVLPSDIIRFSDWLEKSPQGETLVSGRPRDPYNGDYVSVALNFDPNFDTGSSVIPADTYVHGIVVNNQPKAYITSELFHDMTDIVGGERIFVEIIDGRISFVQPNAESGQAPTIVPDKEGFWFSWQAAHPDTELWQGEQ